jgi:uncharacterized membrane protein
VASTALPVVSEGDEHGGYSGARLLALSDGVFAIALTLLVVSVRIGSNVTADELTQALRDVRPELFAYGLSVVVIGAFWVGHHRSFLYVTRIDQGLLWVNVLYLGVVALIPFPTDVLGRYGDRTASVVLYAVVIACAAFVSWCLFVYARWRHLLAAGLPTDAYRSGPARSLWICAVFLVSIPIAFWSPAARSFWVAAVPARAVGMAWARRRHRASAPIRPAGEP